MFGFQRRLVRRCEWLSRMPKLRLLAAHLADRCHRHNLSYMVDQGNREKIAAPGSAPPVPTPDAPRPPPICARRCCASATRLRAHQEELNRLNVYPVPDGDTGTNMALTLESVSAELGDRRVDGRGLPRRSAGARSMGARGNSGVIMSQILRGFADVFRRSTSIDARTDLAHGVAPARPTPRTRRCMRPVEGTILTVVREAAEASRGGCPSGRS